MKFCAGHGSNKFPLSTERLEYAVLIPSLSSSYLEGLFLSWEPDSSAFYMSSGLFNMPSSSIVSHRKKSIQKSLVNFGCCSEPIEDLLHFSLLELDLLCELFQPIKTRNFIMNWEVILFHLPMQNWKQAFYRQLNRFQIHMCIISEYSTPSSILCLWKIYVAPFTL